MRTALPDKSGGSVIVGGDGIVGTSLFYMSVNPTAGNTITIGADVYVFVAALVAAEARTQVLILGTADLTRAAWVDAINGTANANVVQSSTVLARNRNKLLAINDNVSGYAIIENSSTRGVNDVVAGGSYALSKVMTDAGSVWNMANMNEIGQQPDAQFVSFRKITVTALMAANNRILFRLPYTVDGVIPSVLRGGTPTAIDDTFLPAGSVIIIDLSGTGLAAGDVLSMQIFGH